MNDRLSAGVADGGLFVEIAREAREQYPGADIYLLCGRDAAERILTWDYGDPDFARKMLQEFKLLVAPRVGSYEPPAEFQACDSKSAPGDYDRLLFDAGCVSESKPAVSGGIWFPTISRIWSSRSTDKRLLAGASRPGTRAGDGCGWDGAACAALSLRSGGCARE